MECQEKAGARALEETLLSVTARGGGLNHGRNKKGRLPCMTMIPQSGLGKGIVRITLFQGAVLKMCFPENLTKYLNSSQ
jgi:hypothetical protein